MKRLIPTAILLILLVSVCIIGNKQVIKMCEETNKDIKKCYQAYENGDYSLAVEVASTIENHWRNKEGRLAFFVNHGMLDDISVSVSRLAAYTPDTMDFHFALECIDIKTVLLRVCDEQKLLIENFY